MSKALEAWAYYPGVWLDFTRPGNPTDDSHGESFNGRLPDECLNVHQCLSIEHARATIAAWRHDYNEVRPHGSLGDPTSAEFIKNSSGSGARPSELILSEPPTFGTNVKRAVVDPCGPP